MSSEIDLLCIGSFVLRKEKQPGQANVGSTDGSADFLDDYLSCPRCSGEIVKQGEVYLCEGCEHTFGGNNGIPTLFWPHEGIEDRNDVTKSVKAFYEETPFPNYDAHESVRSLIEKSRKGLYARRLNEAIPYNSDVLEVGCGTGQLANFLGASCRRVIGTDICLNSLRIGEAFRRENELNRVRFLQMNLFRPALKGNQFDVVLCNGVLHHTADPHRGFRSIVSLVKPGGYVVIGLYNTYGRLMTDLRRHLFHLSDGSMRRLDPVLRRIHPESGKHEAWFKDQYCHPHESKHTFGEVLNWFDEAGLEFIRGIPALRPDDDGLSGSSLFEPQQRGTRFEHFLVQACEILGAGQKEGGFFIMIGRKPTSTSDATALEINEPEGSMTVAAE